MAQKRPRNGPEMVQKWPRKRLQNPLIECPHFFPLKLVPFFLKPITQYIVIVLARAQEEFPEVSS